MAVAGRLSITRPLMLKRLLVNDTTSVAIDIWLDWRVSTLEPPHEKPMELGAARYIPVLLLLLHVWPGAFEVSLDAANTLKFRLFRFKLGAVMFSQYRLDTWTLLLVTRIIEFTVAPVRAPKWMIWLDVEV